MNTSADHEHHRRPSSTAITVNPSRRRNNENYSKFH
ncbi:hypothetical protein COLO4_37032 [Corchorus olitorius]|uniref:Uncharacterized protein n=1 Tax=Corchorus olitorius TaxID=93759 RepID=A0A1R3G3P4_9ROSI|nr:hypothetical protein COLO4_37032 [Corchorus olitorius]